MNLERFREIVGSYGSSPDRWPEDERGAARNFAIASKEAKHLIQKEVELDRLLDRYDLPEVALSEVEVPNNRRLALLINWMLPDFSDLRNTIWRPALIGAFPIMVGIVIGLKSPDETGYALTAYEELELLAITDYPRGALFDE